MLDGCKIKDRKSTEELLEKLNLPLVNQLAVEIKLMEVWKTLHESDYPIQLEKNPIFPKLVLLQIFQFRCYQKKII